jgi:2-polyprenyl-3-methyl-5-hydroxy-6-metoxy-1,4-benzoquinol methylase
MSFEQLRQSWQQFGERDALWAVLTTDGKRGNRWDTSEFFATGIEAVSAILAWAEQSGAAITFGKALDFGCGVGRLTQALAARFESVVGVDVAESMIARARQLNQYPASCEYRVNDVDDLRQFPDASFDFIMTIIVLQHIEPANVMKYLAEFMRVLKPGGVLVFQQPSRKRWRLQPQPGHASIKHRIARAVPLPLLSLYSGIKGKLKGQPPMHAFGIIPERIVQHIEAHSGKVLKIAPDDWGGPGWFSHHYCVVKI